VNLRSIDWLNPDGRGNGEFGSHLSKCDLDPGHQLWRLSKFGCIDLRDESQRSRPKAEGVEQEKPRPNSTGACLQERSRSRSRRRTSEDFGQHCEGGSLIYEAASAEVGSEASQ